MELTRNSKVFFEEFSHVYLLDGKVLLGVTSLMKKHHLSADYSHIKKEVLEQAAEIGTAIHKEIEAYDNGESVVMTDLLNEYRKLGLKHIASEYLVSDDEMVASSIDGVYEGHGENSVILVDYKTTSKVHTRALEWQLGVYSVLFRRQNPEIQVEGCYCLHIDKYKKKILGFIPIAPVTEEEVNALFDCERKGEIYQDKVEQEIVPFLAEVDLASYMANYRHVQEMKAAIKVLEGQLKEIDNQILEYMLDNGINEIQAEDEGVFRVTKEYTKTTLDSAKIKKDLPDVYAKYSKETKVSASLSFKKSKE